MVNLWLVVGITAAISLIGLAIGYGVFLWTRPKKLTWKADVWTIGNKGELKPYSKDVIERIYKKPDITIYRLQKLNKIVPAVQSKDVDYWGKDNKIVNVLIDGENCTIIEKEFKTTRDNNGKITDAKDQWLPLPHDRLNLIKSEIATKNERVQSKKDLLTALMPTIVIFVSILSIVFISYITIEGYTEISDNLKTASTEQAAANQKYADSLVKLATVLGGDTLNKTLEEHNIKREEPPVPPSIG